MTVPILIDINFAKRLPRELFCDLRFTEILSENAISVLSHPCDKNEIRRRQEIFAFFEDDGGNLLSDCINGIKRHKKLYYLLCESKTELERLSLRTAGLRQYAVLRGCLFRLSSCTALKEFDTFKNGENEQKTAEEAEKILSDMGGAIISFREKCRLFERKDGEEENERIKRCASALGIPIGERQASSLKLPPSVASGVLELFPEAVQRLYGILEAYPADHGKELWSYLPQLEFLREMIALKIKAQGKGLPCCFAKISERRKYEAEDIYDIAVLLIKDELPVGNPAHFFEAERVFFLTGTNGGGKTTYLRTLASNLVFFLGGCAVFGKSASIYPFDTVITHFPADERFENTGRLDDEKQRAEKMLADSVGKDAFLFLNEVYSGTNEENGCELLKALASSISEQGHFCLCVTHFYRVSELSFPVLSPAGGYRIERTDEKAFSHAQRILKKYGLDKSSLDARRKNNAIKSAEP